MCFGGFCISKVARQYSGYSSLVLRLTLGVIFAAHGFQKFSGGIDNVAKFFSSVGIPGYLAGFVAGVELVGGVLLILGLFTRLAAILIAAVMVVAITVVKLPAGAGLLGGYELELALLAAAVAVFLLGPQRVSVDSDVIKKEF
ncbi:DoxX family protein [Candidatus Woesearchaeota archaeon]|nr:DoxX family protein [Candidatus Woesearchaeota archaeon]